MFSFKEIFTKVAQLDEHLKKKKSMSFKSPLNPKWVVLSLWVTVQSPSICTQVFSFFLSSGGGGGGLACQTQQSPSRAHTSTELDSCYTDFI